MGTLIKSIDKFNQVLGLALAGLLAVMASVVFFQVFSRFILKDSLRWSEELARYLMVWSVFIGSALAIRKLELISVDAIKELMSEKSKVILNIFVYIACILFLLILVIFGMNMVSTVINQPSPAMNISMGWAYAAIPVGSIFMIVNCVAVVLLNVMKLKAGAEA